jgi:regulator of protease activity HflC (stomatin/prohibitin superfamily)
MFKTRIRKHEIGLCFRYGDLRRVLQPGSYILPGRFLKSDRVEVFDTLKTRFQHPLLDLLIQDEALRGELHVVELNDDERAFVWIAGRLAHVLGPGRHAFWKRPHEVEVETRRVDETRFEHPRMEAILTHADAGEFLQAMHVPRHHRALFFQAGRLIDSREAGLHVFWKQVAAVDRVLIDLREQTANVTGQEIMTADKVTVRLNLLIAYLVADAKAAVTTVEDYNQSVYQEAQLALRTAVGTRTLDRLLGDKDVIDVEVRSAIAERAAEFGVTIKSVGLRDVILPGDMKQILNQVIEAEKQAEADLIRRREETAAARSQANTAKLLAANPTLVRMKELEALKEILNGAKATFVLGRGDLFEQVRTLVD